MARGGARNRSGPKPDPDSLTSATRGLTFSTLPAEGYDGEAPAFPLPDASGRELAVWAEAWRTPQAVAWAAQPWRWRTVAMWARWSVRMEDPEASAALGQVVVRFADQVGLTPAGLKENGWRIATAPTSEADADDGPPAPVTSIKDRLTVVPDVA